MTKVLEINVDDQGFGGVYSLVRNVIMNKPADLPIDIACIEEFEKQENIRELNSYGTNVFYVGYKGNKIIKQQKISKNLQKLIKENDYDTVHIHSDVAYKLYVYGRACKKAAVPKIILHSHSSGTEGSHRKLKEILHKTFRNKLKNIGTVFLTCSEKAAEWMFPNVDKDKIIMINNGIDLNKFRFDPEIRKEVRKELEISDKELVIGHVGRFSYQKNHEYLIRIFEAVHVQNPDTRLLLIGTGELEQDVKKQAETLGLTNSILFLGVRHDVYRLYQAMDVFVLPSRFEGLGIVAVEAQAAGLHVILSEFVPVEANLSEKVVYLPIGEKDIDQWKKTILNLPESDRNDNYKTLKEKQFDISDTVNQLMKVYCTK